MGSKFHHYCFANEVHVITDHKLLKYMVSKAVAMMLQWLQHTMLHIQQCSMHILYKSGPELYITDWLSCHNHIQNQDQEILGTM